MSGGSAYESIVVRIDKCHVHISFLFWIYACKTEVRVMRAAGGLRADFVKGPQTLLFFFLSMFDFTHTGIWLSTIGL